jgi:hypothetical protein
MSSSAPLPLCDGGTVDANVTSIYFKNTTGTNCTITSCTMPGWPSTAQPVPKGTTAVVTLTVPAKKGGGPYEYVLDANCNCGGPETNPTIKVDDSMHKSKK